MDEKPLIQQDLHAPDREVRRVPAKDRAINFVKGVLPLPCPSPPIVTLVAMPTLIGLPRTTWYQTIRRITRRGHRLGTCDYGIVSSHFNDEVQGRGFDDYFPSKTQDQFPWIDRFASPRTLNGIRKGVARYADWGPYNPDVTIEDINDGKTAKWAAETLLGGERRGSPSQKVTKGSKIL